MSGWNNPINAQKYDEYSKIYPGYQLTSRDLIRLAEVASHHVVVDLACGTGVTSQALLAAMGETGRIYRSRSLSRYAGRGPRKYPGQAGHFFAESSQSLA